mgnify:CR=1 FL=1
MLKLDSVLYKRRWNPKKTELIQGRLIDILSKTHTINNFQGLTNKGSTEYRVSFEYRICSEENVIPLIPQYLCSYFNNNETLKILPLELKGHVPPGIIHLFKYTFPNSFHEIYNEGKAHIWKGISIEDLFREA